MGFSEPVASRGGDCVPEVLLLDLMLEDMMFVRELQPSGSHLGGMMSFSSRTAGHRLVRLSFVFFSS